MQEKVNFIKHQIIQNTEMCTTNICKHILVKSYWFCTHCIVECNWRAEQNVALLQSWPFLYSQAAVTLICRGSDAGVRWNTMPCYGDSEAWGVNIWPLAIPICRGSEAGDKNAQGVFSQYILKAAKVMTFQRYICSHGIRCKLLKSQPFGGVFTVVELDVDATC